MPYPCLADFLDELERAGELVRVEAEVDPILEAAEITARTAERGGPALLFGSVKGHNVPLLTNLFGSERRVCRALGVRSPDEVALRIEALVRPEEPEGWFERIKTAPTRTVLGRLPPRIVKTGPCQQVVRLGGDVDLTELPAVQSRPREPGRAITAAVLVTADPMSGRRVVGRYDLQLLGRDRLAVAWAPHQQPARLLAEYARRGEPMPVAIVLGGDPVGLLSAMALLPGDADAWAFAGLLREKPVELVACRSVNLQAPSDADIVIEGTIDPKAPPHPCGPLCTPGGTYAPARPAPVIGVTAVTHRANPVFPAMVSGPPPHEACVAARVLGRIFLPLVRLSVPELIDYDLPAFGAARQAAVVSIRKTHAGQARRVAHAVWGLPGLMFAKLLVVVDEEVDVHDMPGVWSAVMAHMNPGRDVFFQQGPPDPWDSATPAGTLGHKMAIDATAKLPDEYQGEPPEQAVMSEAIRQLVGGRWSEYGLGPT
jgi:4-hydroxy-3-polyprenylbenzoate decarboxylase